MVLAIYNYGVMLRKWDEGKETEYPVDPAQVAAALAANVPEQRFSTGLLSPNTLHVSEQGSRRVVMEYREPQKTGLWLEGSEVPVRIPMPGMIMVRTLKGNNLEYQVYAVKQRPNSPKIKLYRAPLPNVSNGVCWGTVPKPSAKGLAGTSLKEDWDLLLGSRFGNHTVNGKSRKHNGDIRKLYLELDTDKPSRYPTADLISANITLGKLLSNLGEEDEALSV